MSEQPIVHKEKPVQSHVNPFAKTLPDHVSAGAVAIESERAIAEAQGKLVIAKRFPRDQARAYAAIIDACKRPGLAEEACYSFPRGGQTVSGPSIRLAEMLAANWGNIDYGIRELSRKEGVSEMEAYCWDLETNTMSSQKFTVRHIRDTRSGGVKLTEERDIYELTANMGGRRLRARVLAILPADLIQAAVDECSRTLAGGNDAPIADRVRNMVTAFKVLGIHPALIEKRIGHSLDATTGEELADLRKIHNSLRDGVSKIGDWFGDGPKSVDDDVPYDQPAAQPEAPPRPAPPPRAKKGVTAVQETAKPAAAIDVETVPPKPAAASTPPPEQAPPPEKPAASGPRTTLKEGETVDLRCTVEKNWGLIMKSDGVDSPSVQADVNGDFKGKVYQFGTALKAPSGEGFVAGPEWAVGNVVILTVFGRINKKSGAVLPVVKKLVPAEESPDTAVDMG